MKAVILLLAFSATVAACTDGGNSEPFGGAATEPSSTSTPSAVATLELPGGEAAQVVEVLDGDTIDVLIDGELDRVRYIGIDSPESGACLSVEAESANADLVAGKTVLLVSDPDGGRDRFGRLLRYVYADGIFVNAELVRQGFAEATTRFLERTHRTELLAAEREAFHAGRGIWTACPGFGDPPE